MPALLVRHADWPERLAASIEARRSRPYVYGVNDCAVMMRDTVRDITGTDLFPGVVPPRSLRAAVRFLRANGWSDIEAMMDGVLGTPCTSPRQARRGDVVSFDTPDGELHLAIAFGSRAATPGPVGLAWVPMTGWRKAWRVG